jgi:hypothetical protein
MKRGNSLLILLLLQAAFVLGIVPLAAADEPAAITFKKFTLDKKFRSEGVAIGDFNHDGKMDVAAGSVYYAAPDWKMHVIADKPGEYDPHGYSNSFCNYATDLNGDGWSDLIVVDFPGKETWWWENPRDTGKPWKRHTCIKVTNNESPTYLDIDGDGKRELVCSTQDKEIGSHYLIARPRKDPYQPWDVTKISVALPPRLTHQYYHGLGVGDINRDGRNDVIVPDGWWEGPKASGTNTPGSSAQAAPWTFHNVSFGAACAQMYAYDFDGDGDNDVLSSSAHQTGMWWHEQTPAGWKQHEISREFSQTHALCLADINGDGLMDFVTGKRWWAHGPKGDANPDHPAVMYWFELQRKDGKASWVPHKFDEDSGVGTQFEVSDANGDGLLDVAVSNKKGVHFFLQERGKSAK